jgi:hypothetical protein
VIAVEHMHVIVQNNSTRVCFGERVKQHLYLPLTDMARRSRT